MTFLRITRSKSSFWAPCILLAHSLLTLLVTSPSHAQVSRAQVDQIVSTVESLYKDEVAAQGGKLVVEILNDDPSVVGSADRRGENFYVRLHGGLIDHAELNEDVLTFAICHELGHLIGGLPHRPAPWEWDGPTDSEGKLLISSEGQADYWAAKECMPRALQASRVKSDLSKFNSVKLTDACKKSSNDRKQEGLCVRTAFSGFNLFRLVHPYDISFDRAAPERPEKTLDGVYPSVQCRLDTVVAAVTGQPRPACWFAEPIPLR